MSRSSPPATSHRPPATRALALILLAIPALAADQCPWLNSATAVGILGGQVQTAVTPTACEFTRPAAVLRIEVTSAAVPHTQCPRKSESLKAIGNEANACAYEGKPGWLGEQVTGRVRDQAFLVRVSTSDPHAAPKTLREKARNIAEQVAGFLF